MINKDDNRSIFLKNARKMLWKALDGWDDDTLRHALVTARQSQRDDQNRAKTSSPRLAGVPNNGFRVFLGNSPWRSGDRFGVRAGSRWPFSMPAGEALVPGYVPFPFFLAYTTAVLEKAGNHVSLLDGVAEGIALETFYERAGAFKPDLVILETSTPTINLDLEVAWDLRFSLGESCRIALCGPHASTFGAGLLASHPFVDFILVGEYEYTARDLAQALKDKGDLGGVAGLLWRDEKGAVRENPRRERITDLDALPWPAFHHLPMLNYNDDFRTLPKPNVQMWASRGCPFKCSFCAWPQTMYGNSKYLARNPADVADEMAWLVKEYDFKGVYFDDDTFNIGKERILKLCDEIRKRNINVPWAVMARADTCDEETLTAMRDAGMVGIKFGVESASPQIVANCGKNLDLAKVEESLAIAKKLGLKTHLTFTFGLPGETKKTIDDTIAYALKLDPTSAQFSLVTPFPGTRLYAELKGQGRITADDWSMFDGNRYTVVKGETLTQADLEEALSRALKIWREHVEQKERALVCQVEETYEVDLDDKDNLRDSLKKFYTEYKQYYVTNAYYQMQRRESGDRFYDYLAAQITDDMDILEIGSSSGVSTMENARFARSATGVDISPSAQKFSTALAKIEHKRFKLIEKTLKKDFQSDRIKNIKFVAASAEKLPFEDDKFDLAYSTDVFEHIVEPKNALKEMVRCVKPGGHILVYIIIPESLDVNLSVEKWTEDFINMPDRDAVSLISIEDFMAWVSEFGLEVNLLDHSNATIFAHLRVVSQGVDNG